MRLMIAAFASMAIFAVGETVDTGHAILNTLISTLGPVGFMAWFCWYTVTYRDPATQKHYEGIVATVCATHEKAVGQVVQEFREERLSHREEVQQLAASLEQSTKRGAKQAGG